MAKVLNTVYCVQWLSLAAVYFILLQLYSRPTDYSDLSTATIQDKIWYVGEAALFAMFAIGFALMNFIIIKIAGFWKLRNLMIAWEFLSIFFVIRLICETIWAITGISVNSKYIAITLFSCLFSGIICIALLPYLKKILKQEV